MMSKDENLHDHDQTVIVELEPSLNTLCHSGFKLFFETFQNLKFRKKIFKKFFEDLSLLKTL